MKILHTIIMYIESGLGWSSIEWLLSLDLIDIKDVLYYSLPEEIYERLIRIASANDSVNMYSDEEYPEIFFSEMEEVIVIDTGYLILNGVEEIRDEIVFCPMMCLYELADLAKNHKYIEDILEEIISWDNFTFVSQKEISTFLYIPDDMVISKRNEKILSLALDLAIEGFDVEVKARNAEINKLVPFQNFIKN